MRKGASRRPSVCIAIPALTALLRSISDTYNYYRDGAYDNDFLLQLKAPMRAS
jgi:hypothetical protein